MFTGHITQYHRRTKCGLLDCPELDLKEIAFSRADCEAPYRKPKAHDIVAFILERSTEDDFGYQALRIMYKSNSQFDLLRQLHQSGAPLRGYLRKTGSDFFVKDHQTKLLIKLSVSPFEVDLQLNYDMQKGKSVRYEIDHFGDDNWIHARLKHRTFSPEYRRVTSGKVLSGIVLSKVGKSYKVKILNSLSGIVPFVYSGGLDLEAGSPIELAAVGMSRYGGTILFRMVAENLPAVSTKPKPIHRSLLARIDHSFHLFLKRAVAAVW